MRFSCAQGSARLLELPVNEGEESSVEVPDVLIQPLDLDEFAGFS